MNAAGKVKAAVTAARDLVRVVTSGTVSQEKAAERLAICRACPEFKQDTGRCGLCGCPMARKVTYTEAACPFKDADGNRAPRWV